MSARMHDLFVQRSEILHEIEKRPVSARNRTNSDQKRQHSRYLIANSSHRPHMSLSLALTFNGWTPAPGRHNSAPAFQKGDPHVHRRAISLKGARLRNVAADVVFADRNCRVSRLAAKLHLACGQSGLAGGES